MFRRNLVLLGTGAGLGWMIPSRGARANVSDIVLGQSAPLSGPYSPMVQAFNAGASLAFNHVNATGGIGGRRIRWVTVDDRGNPAMAQAICEKLIQDQQAVALFGCTGNMSSAAIEPLLRTHGVPSLGGLWVADSVRAQCLGAAYFVRASHAQEAAALALHLATIGMNRVGVAYLSTPFGQEGLKIITDALAQQRLTVVGTAAVTQEGATAQEAARKLLALSPQAVIMFINGAQAATMMQVATELGRHPAFYGLSLVADEDAIRRISPQARGLAVSQIAPYPWSETEGQVMQYREQAQAAKVPIGYASLEGWLNAQIMIEALRRCRGDINRQHLHACLKVLQWYVAGMTVDFSRQEIAGSRFVDLVQWSGAGRYVR